MGSQLMHWNSAVNRMNEISNLHSVLFFGLGDSETWFNCQFYENEEMNQTLTISVDHKFHWIPGSDLAS